MMGNRQNKSKKATRNAKLTQPISTLTTTLKKKFKPSKEFFINDYIIFGYIRKNMPNFTIKDIINLIGKYYGTDEANYKTKFSSIYCSRKIIISENESKITGYSTVRCVDPIVKGKISKLKLQFYNHYSKRDYYFYGLCSNLNKPQQFLNSSYYPYNGKFIDIYGICADENSVVSGTMTRVTKNINWKKPLIPNQRIVKLDIVYNFLNNGFILISYIMNDKKIICNDGDYTLKIPLMEEDQKKEWYPVVSQLGCFDDWCKIMPDDNL